MAADVAAFYAELNAGAFTLTDRGLMAGAAYRLDRLYNDRIVDPAAHTMAKVNPKQVKALTNNNKMASFDAISGPVWPS
jgi:hypothetical protein